MPYSPSRLHRFFLCGLLFFAGILLHACNNDEDEVLLPVVESLSRPIGPVDVAVAIRGSGFSPDRFASVVAFNGTVAPVLLATPDALFVRVPAGATSGPVTVTVSGHVVEGPIFEVGVEAMSIGGNSLEAGYAVVADEEKNIYIGGSFQGSVNFGPQTLVATREDGFIAKYDAAGNFLWVKQLEGSNYERVRDLAIDNQGNIYVTGTYSSDYAMLEPFQFRTEIYSIHGFVARLSNDGTVEWANALEDSDGNYLVSVDVDDSNGVFVTGTFNNKLTIGTTTLTWNGSSDVMVIHYSSAGNLQWATSFGGPGAEGVTSIAVGKNSLFVSGIFNPTFRLPGGPPITPVGSVDAFVVKLSLAGEVGWVRLIGSAGADEGPGLAVDANGDCITGGFFEGTAAIGSTVLQGTASQDLFLTKLSSSDGSVLWARSAGDTGYDAITSIGTGNSGAIYITGQFEKKLTLGSKTMESVGGRDVFVAAYSSSGECQFLQRAGADNNDFGNAIFVDPGGVLYVTGSFAAETTFGSTTVEHSGGDGDVFLWKIRP